MTTFQYNYKEVLNSKREKLVINSKTFDSKGTVEVVLFCLKIDRILLRTYIQSWTFKNAKIIFDY
jgi:hypothetical protein